MHYHIAHTPDGVHVHRIDPETLARAVAARASATVPVDAGPALRLVTEATANALGGIAGVIREALGFPDEWLEEDGWDSQLTEGEPHPSVMGRASIYDYV